MAGIWEISDLPAAPQNMTEQGKKEQVERMRKGMFKIGKLDYASKAEMHEHAHYIISSSRQTILNSISQTNPKFHSLVRWAIDSFISNPNSRLWNTMSALGMYLSKRVSKKVNMYGYNPHTL